MNQQYKCLTALAMFYMTIKLITVLLIYKIVSIGPITTTASSIIIPLWFLIGDVISEVYGYDIAKKIIWAALIFQFVFAIICVFLINLPSPATWIHQPAYNQVLGNLPRVVCSSFVAIGCGVFINSYYVSKWKVLLNGRFFWLRSLAASMIGEAIFITIALTMEFIGVIPLQTLLKLILVSFMIKLIINPIFAVPSAFLAAIFKRIEKIDVYDHDIEFNPFKIKPSKPINDTAFSPI